MMLRRWVLFALSAIPVAGQTQPAALIQVRPQVAATSMLDGQVNTVFLAPRYVTAIRVPEPVNSVVVGDPASFSAEHSEREPQLVFVKPITTRAAETNLLISTTRGLQVSLLLISRGELKAGGQPDVDFLMRYKSAGQFLVQPSDIPSVVVPQTMMLAAPVATSSPPERVISIVPAGFGSSGSPEQTAAAVRTTKLERSGLDDLLDRQRRAPLPMLYGQKPGISPPEKELIKAGVSEVIDDGTAVIVLFSAVNAEDHAVELMPPQIQLGGVKRTGILIRKLRWSTSEQLPIADFRLSRRRLGPGERADGVVVFERPSFKQSSETLFLQMAESGAVDRPALAPIGFGISSLREVDYDGR